MSGPPAQALENGGALQHPIINLTVNGGRGMLDVGMRGMMLDNKPNCESGKRKDRRFISSR